MGYFRNLIAAAVVAVTALVTAPVAQATDWVGHFLGRSFDGGASFVTASYYLRPGEYVFPDQGILSWDTYGQGYFALYLKPNGNLCFIGYGDSLDLSSDPSAAQPNDPWPGWFTFQCANTSWSQPGWLLYQTDGNVVLYDGNWNLMWHTQTNWGWLGRLHAIPMRDAIPTPDGVYAVPSAILTDNSGTGLWFMDAFRGWQWWYSGAGFFNGWQSSSTYWGP